MIFVLYKKSIWTLTFFSWLLLTWSKVTEITTQWPSIDEKISPGQSFDRKANVSIVCNGPLLMIKCLVISSLVWWFFTTLSSGNFFGVGVRHWTFFSLAYLWKIKMSICFLQGMPYLLTKGFRGPRIRVRQINDASNYSSEDTEERWPDLESKLVTKLVQFYRIA